MVCVSPLSMLAVSMLDMASMVVSLNEEMWRVAACFLIWPSLASSRLFNECIMFMNEVKYLQQRQYKLAGS